MIEVTTKSGFTAEINENAFDDMRFLDLVCDMDMASRRHLEE